MITLLILRGIHDVLITKASLAIFIKGFVTVQLHMLQCKATHACQGLVCHI